MRDDNSELNRLLEKATEMHTKFAAVKYSDGEPSTAEDEDFIGPTGKLVQWTSGDGKAFFPAGETTNVLPCGVYEIGHSDRGIYFQKIPVKTEGLIRFPQTNSEKVLMEIQAFWEKENRFREYKLTYKRGIMLWGPAGCHAKGSKILMFDGTTKNVEDIVVGDLLMGPDSNSQKVLELKQGTDVMYRIIPVKGDSFIVNANHILSLQRSCKGEKNYPEILNLKVSDYIKLSNPAQRRFKLRRVGVNFRNKYKLTVDPYFLGIWLGDGTEGFPQITTADKEIVDYVYLMAEKIGCSITKQRKTDSICCSYTIVGDGKKGHNCLRNMLKEIGVLDSKYIPLVYLTASEEDRLQLLAGLIDTDGGYCTASWRNHEKFKKKGYKGYFEIIQKRKNLSQQIVFLARSLGFGVTIKQCVKGIKKNNFKGDYWRISIYGDISRIPTKIARKKSLVGCPNKDPLRTGIAEVECLGEGTYYGFICSPDHLYMTDDFIVHHNSGKSCTIQLIMEDVVKRNGVVVKFTHPNLFLAGMRSFKEIQRSTPVVVLMEDIESILENFSESSVLNILDGVDQVDKVVFLATTNYPEKLGARILNRPSRFDKRFKIGHPNSQSRMLYFKHLIGDENKARELKVDFNKWVEDTEGFSIAHLKELFVAVCILGDDYSEAIETLSSMKEQIVSDEEFERPSMGFTSKKKKIIPKW